MHSNDLLVQFLDFFNQRYKKEKPAAQKVPSVDVSKAVPKLQEVSVRHVEEADPTQDSLMNSQLQQSQNLTERSVVDNQRSYQERRAQLKASQLAQNQETIQS